MANFLTVEELKAKFASNFLLNKELIGNLSDDELGTLINTSTAIMDGILDYKKEYTFFVDRLLPIPEDVKLFSAFLVQDLLYKKTYFTDSSADKENIKKVKLAVMEKEYFDKGNQREDFLSHLPMLARMIIKKYVNNGSRVLFVPTKYDRA